MRKVIALAVLGLAVSVGCGKRELSESEQKESQEFLKQISDDTDAVLQKSMAVHQRFLEVRKEEPKTALRLGKAPLCELNEETENSTTDVFSYHTEVDNRFPEKYREISYWNDFSALVALMELPGSVQRELDEQVWDPILYQPQYEDFVQALKDLKYVIILDGQKKPAVIQTNKETGKKAYVPGLFIGTGFVFEIEGAKYMGQFPVAATNDTQVYVGDWESAESALKSDLDSEIRSVAFDAVRKAKASK